MFHYRARVLSTVAVVLLLASLMISCSKPAAGPPLVLNPQAGTARAVAGNLYTRDQSQAISPDGKFILAEQRDKQAVRMVAIPLDSNTGKEVVFTSIDPELAGQNYISLPPLGWASPTQALYLVCGLQSQGPNKDKRGASIMLGDASKGTAEEVGFIALPGSGGSFYDATVVKDKSKVYVRVTGALWEFDYPKKSLRQVVSGLPSYDSLFYFRMSPTGDYAVYDLHETNKSGLYILDVATGKERPLLPTDKTMSFLPKWSPDGKYILAYTAGQKPDAADLQPWERFEVYQGEDSALPIARELTVVDPQGAVQKTVKVDGKLLMYATWGQDSKTIGFFTATGSPLPAGQAYSEGPGQGFTPDNAMIADVAKDGAPTHLAGLTDLPGFKGVPATMYPSFVEPSGKGMFFTIFAQEKMELWYASRDKAPLRIADGSWLYPGLEPRYDDYVAGVVSTGLKATAFLLSASGSKNLTQFDSSMSQVSIAGYTKDLLVLVKTDYPSETGTLTVYKMYSKAAK